MLLTAGPQSGIVVLPTGIQAHSRQYSSIHSDTAAGAELASNDVEWTLSGRPAPGLKTLLWILCLNDEFTICGQTDRRTLVPSVRTSTSVYELFRFQWPTLQFSLWSDFNNLHEFFGLVCNFPLSERCFSHFH